MKSNLLDDSLPFFVGWRRPASELVRSEKPLNLPQIVNDRRRGERRKKPPAVALGPKARIEDGQNTAVAPVPDEAAKPLLERQDGQRHLILAKRVAAPIPNRLDSRGGNRI